MRDARRTSLSVANEHQRGRVRDSWMFSCDGPAAAVAAVSPTAPLMEFVEEEEEPPPTYRQAVGDL